jgi:hypothetical protein
MKIQFTEAHERAVIAKSLGLAEDVSDDELRSALAARVTTNGDPVEATDYPQEWLNSAERADLQKATKS